MKKTRGRNKRDQAPRNTPEEGRQTPDSPLALLVTGVIMLVFGGLLFLTMKNLFTIVFVGEICYKSSGCKSWGTNTWYMLADLLGLILVAGIQIGILIGCLQVLAKSAPGDHPQ